MAQKINKAGWALVAVAPNNLPLPRDAIAVAVEHASARGTECRELGESMESHALEMRLEADSPSRIKAIRAELADTLPPETDWCLLPAESRRKGLLICDMDSTVIGQECLDELADFAGLKAQVSAITEQAMRGELDFEGALTTRVAMLKGLGLDALEACYKDRISLNPGARTLVETMKAHGAKTVLVSGGFTFFTSRVAAAAGFESDQGNTLLDDGTHLTGEVGLPILGREAKLAALESASAPVGGAANALCIGDGANDLAMIRAAGLGLAYRAKPVVAAEADAAIDHTDLRTALFFQGFEAESFVEAG